MQRTETKVAESAPRLVITEIHRHIILFTVAFIFGLVIRLYVR